MTDNAAVKSPWDTEKDDGSDNPDDVNPASFDDGLTAANISPDIPARLWDELVYAAIHKAIDASSTIKEVFEWMKTWNDNNDPKLPQKHVDKLTLWALGKWENKFRRK
jgi:hypothetical protein